MNDLMLDDAALYTVLSTSKAHSIWIIIPYIIRLVMSVRSRVHLLKLESHRVTAIFSQVFNMCSNPHTCI